MNKEAKNTLARVANVGSSWVVIDTSIQMDSKMLAMYNYIMAPRCYYFT